MNALKEKRIGIDARLFSYEARGIGRYAYELLKELASGNSSLKFVVFLNAKAYDSWDPKNSNIEKVKADVPFYGIEEQILFPRLLNSYNLDIMHFLHFNVPILYRKPFIVTIHDLLLNRYPKSNASTRNRITFFAKYFGYRAVLKSALKRASFIIAVSNFTKRELLNLYSFVPESKIRVIYEGTSFIDSANLFVAQSSQNRYILYVGAAYPHKNLLKTITTLAPYLQENSLTFKLVGREDYFYRRLKSFIKDKVYGKNIEFLGEVDDLMLKELYKNAEFFIMPSLYEGFGLPPLEAMTLGCPVVARRSGSLPEILDNAALFYDSEENLIKAIDGVLKNNTIRNDLIHLGKERVNFFSWKKMAEEIKILYNECDANHGKNEKSKESG